MRKLSELYKEEREAICKKIIDIVGTEFLLCDIIENEAIRQKILDLKPEIQKYYAVSSLSMFRPGAPPVKRDSLIIVRYIFKQNGYNFVNEEYVIQGENGFTKRTVQYKVNKGDSAIEPDI